MDNALSNFGSPHPRSRVSFKWRVLVVATVLLIGCRSTSSRRGVTTTEQTEPEKRSQDSPARAASADQQLPLYFEKPRLRGRVNDDADLLSAHEEAELEKLYGALEQEMGCQVVLLTIPSLPGVSIEDYSLAVANAWALGRRGVDDGLLITVARDNKSARIEVGYGLELVVTDELAKQVIDDMIPHFRVARFFDGLHQGSTEIIKMIHAKAELVGKRKR
jgi:uncharacterized protein